MGRRPCACSSQLGEGGPAHTMSHSHWGQSCFIRRQRCQYWGNQDRTQGGRWVGPAHWCPSAVWLCCMSLPQGCHHSQVPGSWLSLIPSVRSWGGMSGWPRVKAPKDQGTALAHRNSRQRRKCGANLPLTHFHIQVLLCAQFRRQEVLWGQTAVCAEGKPPPVLFIDPYLSTPAGNRCLPSC